MRSNSIDSGRLFLISSLVFLLVGLTLGVLASQCYIFPSFLKDSPGFSSLRPMHVMSVMFWILLGATGCVYSGLRSLTGKNIPQGATLFQWALWVVAFAGIIYSYLVKKFGGR